MWDSTKQCLYDDLRRRREQAALTSEEQQQLERLFHELEEAEWASLRPGLDTYQEEQCRLQVDLDRVHAENAVLEALAERYKELVARAKAQLDALTQERDTLRAEYDRVLG